MPVCYAILGFVSFRQEVRLGYVTLALIGFIVTLFIAGFVVIMVKAVISSSMVQFIGNFISQKNIDSNDEK